MKSKLLMMLLIAVGGVLLGGATNVAAQTVPTVGGYSSTEAKAPEVAAAAAFAVKTQAKKAKEKIKLVAVNSAARQVVAGMNYQMCLNVETTDRRAKTAVSQIVQAVVYKNLKGKYSLTSWTIAACGETAPTALNAPR